HHAFCNERNEAAYNAKAANEAWGRMVPFLHKSLGG
ncbi:MAG: dienelactone hydrolase family protein, partial [Rhodospirillaceae bacterium]|nr:dienelactone hydrolase family protein [Rhodospirillaceae bacterium]